MTLDDEQWLAERFGQHRGHLRSVAYRVLGSVGEADDAVQEAWLRLDRADTSDIDNLGGWLTTTVARISLNMLRARQARREDLVGVRMPDPIVSQQDELDPEQEALLADSIGVAMLVVLETLAPGERVAFVLHDMFAVPFAEIASIVGHSPATARQLASRARRRLREVVPESDSNLPVQRELVAAFLAAARSGDFDRLLAVLDPDVVLRSDAGLAGSLGSTTIRGAHSVAKRARAFSRADRVFAPAVVNGASGLVSFKRGRPTSVLAFTISDRKIVEIDILANAERVANLGLERLAW